MADQVEGNSQLMQAAMTLALEMLRLVPLLLGACAHLSPEMPLQQYWCMVRGLCKSCLSAWPQSKSRVLTKACACNCVSGRPATIG
jgi:hypothetical protein